MPAMLTTAYPAPIREYSSPATAFYVLLYLGTLGVFWTGVTVQALVILVATYVIRILALSIGYHRYFAHRSFTASRPVQFALATLASTAFEGGPLWWAQTHREHHRHADTPDDLHSPSFQGFLYSHFGWFLSKQHRRTDYSQVRDLARFPELVWIDRWYLLVMAAYASLLYACVGVTGVVWGVCMSTILILQATHFVQTVSHAYGGYRRYPTIDNSRNHWWFALLTMGEGFHHNHHYFPSSARFGVVWWEFDMGYQVLRLMQWLGLISELKVPAAAAIRGDMSHLRDLRVVRRQLKWLEEQLLAQLERYAKANGDDRVVLARVTEVEAKVKQSCADVSHDAHRLLIAGPLELGRVFHEHSRALFDAIVLLARNDVSQERGRVLATGAAAKFQTITRQKRMRLWSGGAEGSYGDAYALQSVHSRARNR
jgi:stearoyl-CoA desaturase (Delta-9 desaturase)